MTKEKIKIQKSIKKEEAKYQPRIRIKVKSYDHRVIDEALKGIIEAISRSGAKVIGPISFPQRKKIYSPSIFFCS